MPSVSCAKCKVALKPLKTGVLHVEMFGSPPVPYRATQADLFHCVGCGAQIVLRFAAEPRWNHYTGAPLPGEGETYEYERLSDVPSAD